MIRALGADYFRQKGRDDKGALINACFKNWLVASAAATGDTAAASSSAQSTTTEGTASASLAETTS